jgi:phage gp29-like protein
MPKAKKKKTVVRGRQFGKATKAKREYRALVDAKSEKERNPIRPRAAEMDNPVVNIIDSGVGETVWQTAVDPKTMYEPWNPDDLYQKAGDYSIYEEMELDDQVSVCMQIKKDLVVGCGWEIEAEADEDNEMKEDLQISLCEDYEGDFDDDLYEILSAYDFGFSVTEKQFKHRDEDAKLTLKKLITRHPISWLFHQDKFGNVERYEQQGTTNEFNDIDPNSIIHFVNNPKFSNPYGRSDLRVAFLPYTVKKQIVKFYAIFLEKAASPIPVGKYDNNVSEDVDILKLFNTIKKLQTSTALVIPKDLEMEFIEAKSNGEVFVKAIDQFNMFIGRAIFVPDLLGFQGAQTTGGSQALGREQMVIFFKHIARRRKQLEGLVNKHIIKPLVIWNYGFQEKYPKFKLKAIEEDKAVELATKWLEAVKGKIWKPSLAEINLFKQLCGFPETTEEEWEVMQAEAKASEMRQLGLDDDGNPIDKPEPEDEKPSGKAEKKKYAANLKVTNDDKRLAKDLAKFKKIAIVGNPVSGKSTLGNALSSALGIPRISTDSFIGKATFDEMPSHIIEELKEKESYIVSGVQVSRMLKYGQRDGTWQPDAVVFVNSGKKPEIKHKGLATMTQNSMAEWMKNKGNVYVCYYQCYGDGFKRLTKGKK